ncbi:FeoA family protein [Pinisolibacter sp.]|uniref:FeoA family protein n=1 Tax=Pinisolibacter sp. TaxID=2172024 RepID=UPI002FDDFF5F
MSLAVDIATADLVPAGLVADTSDRLGRRSRGWSGWVTGLTPAADLTITWTEMERRLLEMGFVEGARVEILQEGPIGRDPIAVRVDDLTVALRRRDADVILVAEA